MSINVIIRDYNITKAIGRINHACSNTAQGTKDIELNRKLLDMARHWAHCLTVTDDFSPNMALEVTTSGPSSCLTSDNQDFFSKIQGYFTFY